MNESDDRELLLRLRAGDKESFRIIFDRNASLFLAFARRLLRESDVAEDIVQNIFMRLWITRERLDPSYNLRNYLLVCLRNEIYSYLRMAFNARRADVFEYVAEVEDSTPDSETNLYAADLEALVNRCVEAMPERRREIFVMSRSQHLSNAEIARRLNLSVRTVEKHIELALSDLRNILNVSIVWLIMMLW